MKNNILVQIMNNTIQYMSAFPKEMQKEYGQFFTNIETAKYMANMLPISKNETISLMEPGCGNILLSTAVICRLIKETHVKNINLALYEIDERIRVLLNQIIEILKKYCCDHNIILNINCVFENFITSNAKDWLSNNNTASFDYVICNPPYKKIGKQIKP